MFHDNCADYYPPNEFFGFDVCIWAPAYEKSKKFDAISNGMSILWEVKTDNQNEFIRGMTIRAI